MTESGSSSNNQSLICPVTATTNTHLQHRHTDVCMYAQTEIHAFECTNSKLKCGNGNGRIVVEKYMNDVGGH